MRRVVEFILACGILASAGQAAVQTPQMALADAAQYTVQIFRFSSVGLNADDGQSAKATGFLFDRKRGWILTNAHVASRSPARLEVAFKQSDEISAKRVFVDHYLDMAILEIDPAAIPANAREAQLDCRQFPAVGTPVAIFGNPSDFRFVASRGIVSGTSWLGQREHIQSDATINSGNSGGPLINLETGQVVGLAAESYRDTSDDHSTSVAFSEPMPPICTVIDLLRKGEDANVRLLDAAIATGPRDERPTVAVTSDENGPLKAGDLILSVDKGPTIRNPADLIDQLRGKGETVSLSVRRGGETLSFQVGTKRLPSILAGQSISISGLVISEPWRLDSGFSGDKGRLVVDSILPETPAENLNVSPYAVVISVDGKAFATVSDLYLYLSSKDGEGEVEFIVSESSDEVIYHSRFTAFRLGLDDLKWIRVEE
jgi:serine protease Do